MAKFFTWTKGDRYNAAEAFRSGRVVPVPVECLSIKGFDYGHDEKATSKPSKRPPPLKLKVSPGSISTNSSMSSESFALHEAAVKSATTFISAMTDVLRSPQLSAHLSANRMSDTDPPPLPRRPRARTVPSAPLYEAPTTSPAELLGSVPGDEHACSTVQSATDETRPSPLCPMQSEEAKWLPTIPKASSYPPRSRQGLMLEGSFYSDEKLPEPSEMQLVPDRSSPSANTPTAVISFSEAGALVGGGHDSDTSGMKRPSLSVLQRGPIAADTTTSSLPLSHSGSSTRAFGHHSSGDGRSTIERGQSAATEGRLMEQLTNMRAEHDAHIRSLNEAHETEMRSHLSYIGFLEGREKAAEARLATANNERTEALEDCQEARRQIKGLSQREQALSRELYDLQNREAKFSQSAVSGAPSTPIPCSDGLQILPRSRQRRTISDLGGATDISHPLHQQICECRLIVAEKDPRVHRQNDTERGKAGLTSSKEVDNPETLNARVSELEQLLVKHKDLTSAAQKQADRYHTLLSTEIRRQSRNAARMMETPVPAIEDQVRATVAEKKLRIRAQSRLSEDVVDQATSMQLPQPKSMLALLENEVEHCVREIVMYKLDIRGYRKDLKRAQARIERLSNSGISDGQAPEEAISAAMEGVATPTRYLKRHDSGAANEGVASAVTIRSGLGVSVLELNKRASKSPATPTRTAMPLSPTSLPRQPLTLRSPTPELKSPLRVHKKLPKPPISTSNLASSASSTPYKDRIERMETLRSLSESIISSYANRATTEEMGAQLTPRTTPGSDPLLSGGFPTTPLSKFTSTYP